MRVSNWSTAELCRVGADPFFGREGCSPARPRAMELPPEIGDGLLQPFVQADRGRPAEQLARPRDVGPPLRRIVLRQGTVRHRCLTTAAAGDLFRELPDRELLRVAEVDGIVH